jgi:hypothetical protein
MLKEIIEGIKKSRTEKQTVDAQEAYNLWDSLRNRYDGMEQIQIIENFIHDSDFNLLTQGILKNTFEEQANKLENLLNKYQISLPKRPPKSVRTPSVQEAYTDRYLSLLVIDLLKKDIDVFMRSIETSLTNDNIRNTFHELLNREFDLYDKGLKYLKLKGWFSTPPQYPNLPKGTKEKLDTSEAFQLWDHLIARYDAVEITQVYQNQAHDKDFKFLLGRGLKDILEKQINILEKEMDHFGLPLPARPPKSVKTVNTELLEDELIFRELFSSIQDMLSLHVAGIKQTTTNDRLRGIIRNFLDEELNTFNNFAKYGKAKGWTRPVPMHRPRK